MPGPKPNFHLDEDILKDLLFLAKHAERIEEAVNLAGQAPPSASFDDAVEYAAQKAKMPLADVERILHTVNNILRVQARMRVDAPQFTEAATRAFEERPDDPAAAEDLETWKNGVDPIRQVLGKVGPDHPFSVARKAERLARAQQHVLFEVKIITDLRPVFSSAGDEILRSIVTHRLLIDYFDGNRVKRTEFGMDGLDLAELRKACERAELKAVTLKEALKGTPWAASLVDDAEAK